MCSSTVMERAEIELRDVTKSNVKQLKRLNQIVLPVSYDNHFYATITESGQLSKAAYLNDTLVGCVCSSIVTEEDECKLYIMTLACLPPYRRRGIGTRLLRHVLSLCESMDLKTVFLHMQIDNEVAVDFYGKFGFNIVRTVKNYYKRCDPSHAYLLEKRL